MPEPFQDQKLALNGLKHLNVMFFPPILIWNSNTKRDSRVGIVYNLYNCIMSHPRGSTMEHKSIISPSTMRHLYISPLSTVSIVMGHTSVTQCHTDTGQWDTIISQLCTQMVNISHLGKLSSKPKWLRSRVLIRF